MKKLFLTMIVACMTMAASAQVYLGGSVGLTGEKNGTTDKSTTYFTIAPEIGYNLSDSWAIGTKIAYYSKEDVSNQFAFAPYVRYTPWKLGQVSIFVDGGATIGFGKDKTIDKSFTSWNIGVQPGIAVNLTEKLSFVAHFGQFGYGQTKYKDIKADSKYGFGLDLSSVSFGLFFNF